MTGNKPLSEALAEFVAATEYESIPEPVRRWAKTLMLDAIGNAYASTRFDFAHKALTAFSSLGGGTATVIGMPIALGLRDAALLNGSLIHGLDYDDTYLPGGLHLTASCLPPALALAEHVGGNGREFLTAFILGLEAGVRLGAASKGGFLKLGFHPTSLIGTFAGSLVAGRSMRLGHHQLVMAQGIALSFASGNMQPTQEGAWAKRLHGGWAGAAGMTAAAMGRQGFTGPRGAYDGRYGLFPSFLGPHAANADLELATRGLGEQWELTRSSLKLYPVCFHSHAFMNAALAIRREPSFDVSKIESVRALVAETAVPFVCEPLAAKRKPNNSYAAQFSLPYAVACCFVRGRFGLEETEESVYSDPQILALADKVSYEIDPNSGFPKYRSGELIVRMKDKSSLSKRINIVPDEHAADDDILRKFTDNTRFTISLSQAQKIQSIIMDVESIDDVRVLTRQLSG